jgi:predicted SnoaL-like aldol condensation-catalyzing enzyme
MASMEKNNKTLVLEAFNTLFNKRDYEAAARYWSPNYIQHSAHIRVAKVSLTSSRPVPRPSNMSQV